MSALVPILLPPAEHRQNLLWRMLLAAVVLGALWGMTELDWALVWRTSPFLLKGLSVSCVMTALSIAAGLPLGIALAAARMSRSRPLRWLAVAFIEIVRATPQLMVIFWIYFTYPALTGHIISSWTGAAAALSLIAGVYLAEVIRSGLLSIPAIQAESAEVMGMSRLQIFIFVCLPQACRNMLPAFIATVIMMFKTTSLVYVLGIVDIFSAVLLLNNREFAPYTLYTVMAVVYFLCCYALSSLIRLLDPKYALT
jgi:polar amino acid transport system permease protein